MAVILVVDDEAEIRDLIRRVLIREGHQVDVAIHGAAGLEAVNDRSYDLIICNVRMPVMDGPTFYAHIHDRDPHLARRFVFCTGDIVSLAVRTFLQGTGQPVLAKPFSIATLRELVRGLLSEPSPILPKRWVEECFAPSTLGA